MAASEPCNSIEAGPPLAVRLNRTVTPPWRMAAAFAFDSRSFSIAAVAARSRSPGLGPLKVILILAMDQQFALPLARHLPARLDRLRLGVEDLAGALPALAQGAPLIAALNHVNILTVGHVRTPNRLT